MKACCLALLAFSLAFSGCSKKSDLTGSWRAETNGDNVLTMNRDGSASMRLDTPILFGSVKGEFHGEWKLLNGDRLLLEFAANGKRTSEVNRFEFADGDLVLTRADNGRSARYTRVAGPDSSETGKSTGADPEQEIRNNLRQIASAAQQYFLEHGVDSATYEQLLGAGHFKPLKPVLGERYAGLVIRDGQPIRITTSGGRVFTHEIW